ncbi:PREDICTED: MKI67 FHA domain-interacting nucleolar phosphoprotein-like [Nicrophorus vespilloides]|uniref:MKI67 FHA domain-interacting nucleolar phosphoprotein-like n=1 Tax=Nicrophorus vespilloides TaxID=110193 RepID=A0ABM1N5U7_NICVS|nr:PREDICTED: MKI67 FHA domain-interacting nucleolar phosphoprotein-like [Nicrophorus vespilloides]
MKKVDESLALEKKEQTKFASKIKLLKEQVKDGDVKVAEEGSSKERAIIYIGHLPHGFYEKELREYFGQFGKVTKVTVPRAKRSGRPRSYAYVEFLFMDVAKIAAETMDNYLMFDKRLVVKVLPQEKCRKLKFGGRLWAENSTPYISKVQEIAKLKNEPQSEEKYMKNSRRQLGQLNKKIKKLAALGIKHTVKPVNVPKELKEALNVKKTVKKNVTKKTAAKVVKADVEELKTKPKVNVKKVAVAANIEAKKKPTQKVKPTAKGEGKKVVAVAPKKAVENKKITVDVKVAKKTLLKKDKAEKVKKPAAVTKASPKKEKVAKAKKQLEVKSSPKKEVKVPVKEAPKMQKKKKEALAIKKPALRTTMKKKDKVLPVKKALSKDKIAAMMNDSNLVTKKTFKSKK